jgi:hypothetical protein
MNNVDLPSKEDMNIHAEFMVEIHSTSCIHSWILKITRVLNMVPAIYGTDMAIMHVHVREKLT